MALPRYRILNRIIHGLILARPGSRNQNGGQARPLNDLLNKRLHKMRARRAQVAT